MEIGLKSGMTLYLINDLSWDHRRIGLISVGLISGMQCNLYAIKMVCSYYLAPILFRASYISLECARFAEINYWVGLVVGHPRVC